MERTDQELVKDYLAGDEAALAQLVQRHLKPALNFVYRLLGNRADAEDVIQETFFKAWKSLKKYDAKKNFKTWLYTIARNSSIDFLRKKKDLTFSNFDTDEGNVLLETVVDDALLPDELAARSFEAAEIDALLTQLSPSHREVLILRYYESMTFDEIGLILGKPLHTVKSQHFRAIRALRSHIKAPKQAA